MAQKNNCYHKFVIALGGNLKSERGSPAATLKSALVDLACDHTHIEQMSRFYETAAYPISSQSNFANAAALGKTALSPLEFLEYLHRIEKNFDRQRGVRWGARTLDLDLILYDQLILPNIEGWHAYAGHEDEQVMLDEIVVPHPKAHKRDFVLQPLTDIAANWVHPVFGKPLGDIYQEVKQSQPEGYVDSILNVIE